KCTKSVSSRSQNVHFRVSSRRNIKLESHLEEEHEENMGEKYMPRKKKPGHWALQFPRLGIWYMTSSISYILRKAKAFYNECCCDAFEDPVLMGKQVTLVDSYFSTPVVPPPTISPYM
ncbi:hypothetical protein CFOL_v3_32173, partial [Cephalotus follicularis]